MVRVFSRLKVVPHLTLDFTLGYRPENCVKITTEVPTKMKCKFLKFKALIPAHGNTAAGPVGTGTCWVAPPVGKGLNVAKFVTQQDKT